MAQWAQEKTPGISVSAETERFRDHTFGTARSDWPGTWRNWMRKAFESRCGGAKTTAEPPEPAWRREQRERNEAFLGPAAAKRSQPATTTATAEVIDVTSRLLG